MAKQKFDVAKGVKDWYKEDAILRNQVRSTLRNIFEKYGFVPIETPIIERRDSLGFKGGGEIQKEVFRLEDQGGRKLALRFDQTVPLARFVASHKDLKFPFKRYAIGEVFRDGPTQPEQGRYRSFTQCDADILGVKEMAAEAELFALAQDAFKELGLGNVEVKINNRKLLEGLLDYAGVPDHAKLRTITTLDKLDKIGLDGIKEELSDLTIFDQEMALSNDTLQELFEKYKKQGISGVEYPMKSKIISELDKNGYEEILSFFQDIEDESKLFTKVAEYKTKGPKLLASENVGKIMDSISTKGTNDEIYNRLTSTISSPKGKEGLEEVKELLDYSSKMGLDFIQLDPCLARGLDYYTGTTIEVYLKDKRIVKSAILAGGRFDDMVGDFRGENEDIPAVGFSFGLERLVMVLKDYNKDNIKPTNTELYLIPIGKTTDECLGIAHTLRNQGLNIDMELQKNKKIGNSIGYADTLGIPYVGLIGEDEIKEECITVKNLKSGIQEKVKIENISDYLK
ncbi:hypothetical protein GF336_01350 [Candidatus Woesearchaeota archaeon]|nr:hypothetical protein [Candidatus Woesearchaeota archaeon]